RSFNEHIEHIRKVFEAVRLENIKLKRSKCQFAQSSVVYLGHYISLNKIQPLNSNTQAILDYPAPNNIKTLRGFLGKANYYYRFIPDRTRILDPLYKLTKKNQPFVWTEECQIAFDEIKRILTSSPALCIYDPEAKTRLYTDASRIGVGAVLKQ